MGRPPTTLEVKHYRRKNSGSFAILAAIRRASSLVMRLDYWSPLPTSKAREQSSSASQFKFKWQVSNPVANDIQEDNMDTANLLSFAFYSIFFFFFFFCFFFSPPPPPPPFRMEFGSAVHLDTEQSNSAVCCNVR